jgi:hypothetical protein
MPICCCSLSNFSVATTATHNTTQNLKFPKITEFKALQSLMCHYWHPADPNSSEWDQSCLPPLCSAVSLLTLCHFSHPCFFLLDWVPTGLGSRIFGQWLAWCSAHTHGYMSLWGKETDTLHLGSFHTVVH